MLAIEVQGELTRGSVYFAGTMRSVSGQSVQRLVLITFSLRGLNPTRAQNTSPPVSSSSDLLCSHTCSSNGNGECDDGGSGAESEACDLGTDCVDCAPRSSDCSSQVTSQNCPTASDGECDDGGPGAEYCVCNIGTDCFDCGLRVGRERRPECAVSNTRSTGGSILIFPALLMPCVIMCWCFGIRARRRMRVHDALMAQARVSGQQIGQYPATYPAYPGGVDHSIIVQAQPVIMPSAVFAAPVATAVTVESYSPTADESPGAVAVGVLQGSVQQGNGVQHASPRRRQDPTSEA